MLKPQFWTLDLKTMVFLNNNFIERKKFLVIKATIIILQGLCHSVCANLPLPSTSDDSI